MLGRFVRLNIYQKKLIKPYINTILSISAVVTYLMSILMIMTLIYEHGFLISLDEKSVIVSIYNVIRGVFLINFSLHLLLSSIVDKEKYKKWTLVLGAMLYLTLFSDIFSEPLSDGFAHGVWIFLNNIIYHVVLLTTLSLLQLSNGVIRLLGKRVNPSMIFSISFFILILIGTCLLMLPRATNGNISFVDALFISTSATCVTGLSTVDVATTFTPIGNFIIMMLIQIGGLGVMTLTSFFAIFFMGNASLYNQVLMCDMVNSRSMNSLLSTLIYILMFTLIIESVGALIIFLNIHGTLDMTFKEELFFSIFHSISAFCNAGFSTMSNNLGNEYLMFNHNIFFLTITALVVLGGIGFPILVNLYEKLIYDFRRFREMYRQKSFRVNKKAHVFDMNTTIVLRMTMVLLLFATIFIAILEWNRGFEGMPFWDKCVQSLFTAASPRTAGFNSVATSSFSTQTILIIIFLMMIGGGTQSTAGGIKVNVFAVILLNLRSILYGVEKVTLYNRHISGLSVRKCNSTLILYLFFVFIALFILTILEPDIEPLRLVFEAISALSTVGSSLDVTPMLGNDSKFVIIILMFVGRVGVLTMMSSLIKKHKVVRCRYPSGNIIIN